MDERISTRGPVQPVREKQIPSELGRQNDLLGRLHNVIDELESRLELVLTPALGNDKANGQERPVVVPLARALSDNNTALARAIDRVYVLKDRLDI